MNAPFSPDSMTAAVPQLDVRRRARGLYWQGWGVLQIARELGVPRPTVSAWKRRDGWDAASSRERCESALEARWIQLVAKEQKSGADFKEIDLLGRQIERLARVRRYEAPDGHEGDLNPAVENRNAGPKKKPKRNEFDEEQIAQLRELFHGSMFAYQAVWHAAGESERIRFILKSRQIGATFYFAREALMDAIDSGRNQIFLSASKNQAFQFRSYILKFAEEVGVTLRSDKDKIVLWNGAELIFLGTNSRTAQSYHGNLYVDEVFWIPRYKELRKVASAMASQKQFRSTYFSTPSAQSHEAYAFWTGAHFNRGRPKTEHVSFATDHASLAAGRRCEDGIWRQIVTVEDAEAGGCNLFDIAQLRRENNPEEFLQLFMCQFVDDGNSVFSLGALMRCMVDAWDAWPDFKPFAGRPFGSRAVWLGYDPSNTGDKAALVVLAPPAVPGGKFRILERHQFQGADFAAQAEFIRKTCARFSVQHIGIDETGLGAAVLQLVKQFRPDAVGYSYSVELKTKMVLKALDVIGGGRLEFDASCVDIAAAFLAIRKTVTPSGRQMTYQASRSEDISHADLAWATMHALFNEPLEGATGTNQNKMELFG